MHARVMPNPFEWLLALYSENFERMGRLFAVRELAVGRYVSAPPAHPVLVLDVVEQQPYTSFLKLSHRFESAPDADDPAAYFRVYHDARMVEVTHCRQPEHLEKLFSPLTPARWLGDYRRRMNAFGNKWLAYLAENGYGSAGLVWQGQISEVELRRERQEGFADEEEWPDSSRNPVMGKRRRSASAN